MHTKYLFERVSPTMTDFKANDEILPKNGAEATVARISVCRPKPPDFLQLMEK